MIGVKASGTVPAVLATVAVLADIHGNAPALDAVLAELEADPPAAVVIGGDVAAGPMPLEVLARLRTLPWPVLWLRGNADRDFLAALPPLVRLEVAGRGEVLFCHGTPRSDEERITVFTPDERLAAILQPAGTALVVA